MNKIVQLDESNFNAAIQGKIALIDFWAQWCGPCQMFTSVIEELAAEVDDNILIAKVDVDQSPGLAAKFNVRSIPAVFILKDGKTIKQFNGVQDKVTLKRELESV